MKNTTKRTQKQQQMIDNYNKARQKGTKNLYNVYDNWSIYKQKAFDEIEDEQEQNNGYWLYITTACKMFFSCGYLMDENGKTFLIYHTPTRKYKILYA